MRARMVMAMVTLALVVAEYCLVTWYLPTVEEAVEADGAILSIVPIALLCLSGWTLTTKWESRVPLAIVLAGASLPLALLSYMLMVRW